MNRNYRQLARISDSYKSSLRRIARDKGRSDRPEDIFAQGFASSVLAAFVGLLARFVGLFRRSKGSQPWAARHHARGTPHSGFGKCRNLGPSAPPVKHCKRSDMDAAARSLRRKLRRYALRGYGYQAPDGEIETLSTRSYTMRKPKAERVK